MEERFLNDFGVAIFFSIVSEFLKDRGNENYKPETMERRNSRELVTLQRGNTVAVVRGYSCICWPDDATASDPSSGEFYCRQFGTVFCFFII